MEQECQLEKEIKKFDWKEWTPLIGSYFAPRNISRGEQSQSLKGNEFLNGFYLTVVSVYPATYAISQIVDTYI